MRRTKATILAALLAASLAIATASAQTFNLDWYTIDGGGGTSTGGVFEMSATIGQPDAGVPMIGGTFELTGGFWPGATGERCVGDINFDGQIDLADLTIQLANFATPSGASYEDGDLDGDGDVDLSDLAFMLSVFATFCP